MQLIPCDDSRLSYLGRWFVDGAGVRAAWQGAQLRFQVSGTSQVRFVADVVDSSSGSYVTFVTNIDGGDFEFSDFTNTAEVFTGERTAVFALPDNGVHTVIVKPSANLPPEQWTGAAKLVFKSLQIDDGGTISAWPQPGGVHIGCIGDSWMSAYHDWPRLMPPATFKIYPVAFGGATASTLDAQIGYDSAGVVNSDDPALDAVIINSSVNDYNASTSLASFAVSFASLVDKVRAQQPAASIFLLQTPDNAGAGRLYSKYGPEMEAIAAARSRVSYIPAGGAPSLSWLADNAHLDFSSRQAFAAFVGDAVATQLSGMSSLPLVVNGVQLGVTLYADPGSGNRTTPTLATVAAGGATFQRVGVVSAGAPNGSGVALSAVVGGVETRQELESI